MSFPRPRLPPVTRAILFLFSIIKNLMEQSSAEIPGRHLRESKCFLRNSSMDKIMPRVKIRYQARLRGFPAQSFLCFGAGSRHVVAEETADPAKMIGDLISGFANDGQVKMPADRFGDIAGSHAFFADTMIDGVFGGIFRGQHK